MSWGVALRNGLPLGLGHVPALGGFGSGSIPGPPYIILSCDGTPYSVARDVMQCDGSEYFVVRPVVACNGTSYVPI